MKYNFDAIIDRHHTNAMSTDGYMGYLFNENDDIEFTDPKELISMWIADMEFAIAPEITTALKKRLDHPILGYSMVSGITYSRAFLNWTKSRYSWEFNTEHLVNSQGVIPALYALVGYICKPDEKVLIMTPSYAFFKHATDFNNIELVTSELVSEDGHYTIGFEDFRQKAEDDKVSLCIFCNPHNPTGRVWTQDELRKFSEICFENNVMIISDEIHCDLLRNNKTFTPLSKLFPNSDQIITCMAPSKTFNLAGILFANIIIPNDALRNLWRQKNLPVVNPLSLVAAQAAYTHGHNWLSELKKYLDSNFIFLNEYLATHLPKAIFHIPESTYLAWVNVNAYFNRHENLTIFFAKNAGVLLEGGNMFVSNADGYIRLNIACPRTKLEEGLKKIVLAIAKNQITP